MRTESENTYIWKFDSNISVVCPSCQKEAIVNKLQEKQFSERKCVCSNCGFAKTWNGKSLTYFWHESEMVDPAFNLPLFFQTTFKNKNLWAFNREHISFLEKWIAAEVREKCERDHQYHGSLESTLPKWMTSRKNRGDILKALNKLKNKT
jgi:Zn ribbon nucleic-acid-binding protein